MELKLLERKKIITQDGQSIYDFASPTIRYNDDTFSVENSFLIGEDLIMRPDLLSYTVYGNLDDWDMLLKFNGISNPFAINLNDYIIVPDLNWLESQYYDEKSATTDNDIRSQYLDSTKKTSIDNNKKTYDELIKQLYSTNKNAVLYNTPLTPNLAQPGDTEIKLVNGNAILSASLTNS